MKVKCMAAVGLMLSLGMGAHAQSYQFTDLGLLPNGTSLTANKINDMGQICASGNKVVKGVSTGGYVARWDPVAPNATTGALTIMPDPAGYSGALVADINSSGQIAGTTFANSVSSGSANTAMIWSAGGVGTPLFRPSGPNGTQAYAVNDSGAVAGFAYAATVKKTTYPQVAMLWTLTNGVYAATALPNLPGITGNPLAYSINNLNQVVGMTSGQAWIWLPSAAYGLPAGTNSLGAPPGSISTSPSHINDFGQILGSVSYAAGVSHAMFWLPGPAFGLPAGLSDIGGYPGASGTAGANFNTAGVVVGAYAVPGSGGATRACRWQNGVWQDLNDLVTLPAGWVLTKALGINSSGQISGIASTNGVINRGFLLTPL